MGKPQKLSDAPQRPTQGGSDISPPPPADSREAQAPALPPTSELPPASHPGEVAREPKAKDRLLRKQKNPDGTDADTVPLPPVASPDGPVPRLLHQNERAPAGLARFKISCREYHPQPVRYILAENEAEACEFYLTRATTLAHQAAQAGADTPRLIVTKLPD